MHAVEVLRKNVKTIEKKNLEYYLYVVARDTEDMQFYGWAFDDNDTHYTPRDIRIPFIFTLKVI